MIIDVGPYPQSAEICGQEPNFFTDFCDRAATNCSALPYVVGVLVWNVENTL